MFDARRLDPYIGRPYCPRTADCRDLVLQVQRELFARTVMLPGRRQRPVGDAAQALALRAAVGDLAIRTQQPRDGDLVLMFDGPQAMPGHVGTWFFLDHEPWVLHTSHELGGVCLHRMRDLCGYGLRVEGVYRWTLPAPN